MNLRRSLLAIVLLTTPARAADDFRAALEGVESATVALPLAEKYVKEHPQAADIGTAEITLGQLYGMNGQNDKAAALLDKCYARMVKGAAGDLSDAFGATSTLVKSLLATGDKTKAKAASTRLTKDFNDHPQIGRAASAIEGLKDELKKPVQGDTMAVSFTDIDGHKVDLAELKGKVVLVDFWATWCSICMVELPNVLKAYDSFHDKGFEVIGISLDEDVNAVRELISQRKMAWPQYCDGMGWESSISRKFGIHSLPSTFLIGKDGKVAATNLHGEALETKLSEMLK